MQRDCYLVLGVARGETAQGIRTAYHDLERHFRPDRMDTGSRRALAELTEAYEILSDTQRRRDHDRTLSLEESPRHGYGAGPPDLDPFIPARISLLDDPSSIHPSFEGLRQRFLRSFFDLGVPKSEHLEALHMDVVLTPDQAARGTRLEIGVPAFQRCQACGGRGRIWGLPCVECGQEGIRESEATIEVRVPPLVRPGTVYEVSLAGLGIHNLLLRLQVFTSD
jgi:molecular chaperone DnaJ